MGITLLLRCADLEATRHFYGQVLGWRQLVLGDGQNPLPAQVAMFAAPSGRTHHELLLIEVGAGAAPIPPGRRVGLYHFALKIGDSDDELREALARVKEAEVPIVGMSDHTVTHSLYIKDPDGNEVELYIDVAGVDWRANPALIAAPIKRLIL